MQNWSLQSFKFLTKIFGQIHQSVRNVLGFFHRKSGKIQHCFAHVQACYYKIQSDLTLLFLKF